jgi:fatty acid desaturase
MSYEELREEVSRAGLYKPAYLSYGIHAVCIVCGFVTVWLILMSTTSTYIQFLNGIFLGICMVQAGMLGHDLSHGQVFQNKNRNRVGALVIFSLLCGLSERGWYEKHNAHHKNVNHAGLDPDLDIPFIFSSEQDVHKTTFTKRWIQPYQNVLFFIMLPFVYPNFVFWSFKNIAHTRDRRSFVEAVCITLHFFILFSIPPLYLPLTTALLFCVASVLTGGIYMSMVFAPNHKGEDVMPHTHIPTWKDQITLTRNLYYSRVGFILFGGLDLQIEHHLFPSMSRYAYPKAQPIVKAYCTKHNIEYYETTWWQSMKEIYFALKKEADRIKATTAKGALQANLKRDA